jgi:hypothetical protein
MSITLVLLEIEVRKLEEVIVAFGRILLKPT